MSVHNDCLNTDEIGHDIDNMHSNWLMSACYLGLFALLQQTRDNCLRTCDLSLFSRITWLVIGLLDSFITLLSGISFTIHVTWPCREKGIWQHWHWHVQDFVKGGAEQGHNQDFEERGDSFNIHTKRVKSFFSITTPYNSSHYHKMSYCVFIITVCCI